MSPFYKINARGYIYCLLENKKGPWHIRRLSDRKSLCGMDIVSDLDIRITAHSLNNACDSCEKTLKEQVVVKYI